MLFTSDIFATFEVGTQPVNALLYQVNVLALLLLDNEHIH